jgi:hypothetical protein
MSLLLSSSQHRYSGTDGLHITAEQAIAVLRAATGEPEQIKGFVLGK